METEREELIPGPPGIRLSRIDVGKWFWIGLATFVLSIGCAIAALQGLGPHNPFNQAGLLGETNDAFAFLVAHPKIGWPFLYVFGLVNPGQVVIASIVLLWIAFARPNSPDRVAFVPAVTLTAWVLSNLALWIHHIVGGNGSIFDDRGLMSYGATISLVGCASIALAACGLRRLPRAIVWALCALALTQTLIFEFYLGISPAAMLGSFLLGMAVLAFGFEVAEQSGADLFAFDDSNAAKPASPIVHLRIAAYVLLGCVGVAVYLAIGYALLRGWIQLPSGDERSFGGRYVDGLARDRLILVMHLAATTLGSASLWTPIATLALWVAFVRPTYSERLLFASGTIFGAIFLFPNIDGVFRLYVESSHQSDITAVIGYPSFQAAFSVAGGLALVVGTRGLKTEWRRGAEIFCVVAPACVLIGLIVTGVPLVHIAGGVVLGVLGVILALAIARRAGIDLFLPPEAHAEG